eukprot:365861-Chlamydomonas_euryale.AAC.30
MPHEGGCAYCKSLAQTFTKDTGGEWDGCQRAGVGDGGCGYVDPFVCVWGGRAGVILDESELL